MTERMGVVTVLGNGVTLVGDELKVGAKAPEAVLTNGKLEPVKLSSAIRGKVAILASVPSLDTPVCDIETRRFNAEAAKLGPDVVILVVSMDLPFAQGRWCGAAGVKSVVTLSDHRDASFGTGYGVLIKEARLLARAVFVVDKTGTVQYAEVVPEAATEPDYGAALAAVKKLVGK